MAQMRAGACLCGGVRWSTESEVREILECHCERCRRTTGNYMAASAAPTSDLRITGEPLSWYSPEDDPNVAYGFCSTCGSSMFFRAGVADGTNESTSLCAGSFDAASGLATTQIWFADHAADHVRLDASIPQFATGPTGS